MSDHPGLKPGFRTILWARDFDKLLAFYRDVIRLTLAYPADSHWAEFGGAGASLCIHGDWDGEETPGPLSKTGWAVEDLDQMVAYLRAQGVDASEPAPVAEGVRCSEFLDPEGHPLFVEGA